jgi:hypothetical protein
MKSIECFGWTTSVEDRALDDVRTGCEYVNWLELAKDFLLSYLFHTNLACQVTNGKVTTPSKVISDANI